MTDIQIYFVVLRYNNVEKRVCKTKKVVIMSDIKYEIEVIKQGDISENNEESYQAALAKIEKQLQSNEKIIVAKKIIAVYTIVRVS